MTKNISIIGVNYYPEDTATGLYTTQMSEFLAKKNEVSVITGFPYYPQWQVWQDYATKPTFYHEQINGIEVYRYRQYVPKKPSFAKRIIHILDFTFGSIRNIFKVKKCDVVIAIVPFTFSIALALLIAKLRGAKIWAHIQDFEFDAAFESGLSKKTGVNKFVFCALMKLESFLLNSCDVVSTISNPMIEKLKEKTKSETCYFPNWIDENLIDPESAKSHSFFNKDKFSVLYSGNIGAKQDWDFFQLVVESFKGDKEIEFIVVGDGAKKDDVFEKASNISNVIFHDPVDLSDLNNLLSSADLQILFQKNTVIDTVMPSKVLGMMASAKPSIITGNLKSESCRILNESEGGFFFDSEELDKVIERIKLLKSEIEKSNEIGSKARKYICKKFNKDKVLNDFTSNLDKLLK